MYKNPKEVQIFLNNLYYFSEKDLINKTLLRQILTDLISYKFQTLIQQK